MDYYSDKPQTPHKQKTKAEVMILLDLVLLLTLPNLQNTTQNIKD